jgi:adenylate cyclase
VKGKSDPIKIYELLGTKGTFECYSKVISAYETAFSAYAAGNFEDALAVLQENVSDPPSTVLIERCKAFLQVPPPASWRGIYISTSK